MPHFTLTVVTNDGTSLDIPSEYPTPELAIQVASHTMGAAELRDAEGASLWKSPDLTGSMHFTGAMAVVLRSAGEVVDNLRLAGSNGILSNAMTELGNLLETISSSCEAEDSPMGLLTFDENALLLSLEGLQAAVESAITAIGKTDDAESVEAAQQKPLSETEKRLLEDGLRALLDLAPPMLLNLGMGAKRGPKTVMFRRLPVVSPSAVVDLPKCDNPECAGCYGTLADVADAAGQNVGAPPALSNYERSVRWLSAYDKLPGTHEHLLMQTGVHLEEFAEFLRTISVKQQGIEISTLAAFELEQLSQIMKKGAKGTDVSLTIVDRKGCLDALCDTEITGNLVAWLAEMKKPEADRRVLDSLDRKLVDGKVLRDENGKPAKPPGWVEPDLSDLV